MTGDPKDPKRRATGAGSELWAFICKKALKEACENVARERQLSIVQWLEEALQTAVDAHRGPTSIVSCSCAWNKRLARSYR